MNRELGPQEAKAIGSGTQPQPQPEHRTKRRLRWKLLVGALALALAGYGLADAAHSFGWWPPLINDTDTTTAFDALAARPVAVLDAECDGALAVARAVSDYDNEIAADLGAASDSLDYDEYDRLVVKRATALEAVLRLAPVAEESCGHDEFTVFELGRQRADIEDLYASILTVCESFGLDC